MRANSGSLFGKRVLVTRPVGQCREFAQALREAGAHPILAPVIEIAPPDDPRAAAQAVARAKDHAWLVFTSANGVRSFFETAKEVRRQSLPAKIAAIGSATAKALRDHGVDADLVPNAYVAEELARELVAASAPGERLMIYRAAEARDALPDLLRRAGRVPVVIAAYKTVFAKDRDFASKVALSDVITFTSSSTVRGFAFNMGSAQAACAAAAQKVVACIGPITQRTARETGMTVAVTAREYTSRGMLAALERYFAQA